MSEDHVPTCFRVDKFKKAYNHYLMPLNGMGMWPKTNYSKPLPPHPRRLPGRPKMNRRKDASEGGQTGSNKWQCKNCLQFGHNKRSCKNEKKDPPPKVKLPPGRKRINPLSEVERGQGGRANRGRGGRAGGRGRGGKEAYGAGVSIDPATGQTMIGNTKGNPMPIWPSWAPLPEQVQAEKVQAEQVQAGKVQVEQVQAEHVEQVQAEQMEQVQTEQVEAEQVEVEAEQVFEHTDYVPPLNHPVSEHTHDVPPLNQIAPTPKAKPYVPVAMRKRKSQRIILKKLAKVTVEKDGEGSVGKPVYLH